MRNAGTKLKDFGGGMMGIGRSITDAGKSILGPLFDAVKSFASFGSAVNDMAGRTGLSVAAIGELGYAASQTGASMEDIEKGSQKLAKVISGADEASKGALDTFKDVGLSLADLQKMSPDQQFEAVAKALANVQDPAKRTALAMELFGKSGTKLLPMIDDMEALRQKARDLGIVLDPEQVKAADELGDAMDDVKAVVGGLANQIGAALAGAVTEAAQVITRIVATASKWVKENKQLVVTVAKVAAGVTVAGAAITALGATLFGAGVVLSGIASGIAAVGTVLAVIFSPLGLVVGALAAGVIAWLKWTQSGQAAAKAISDAIGPMLKLAQDTFGGIVDALSAGEIGLAGQIAMAGLKVAFLTGANAIGGIFGDMLGTLTSQILSGDFSGAWATVVSGLTAVWQEFTAGVVSLWHAAILQIQKGMLAIVKLGSKLGIKTNLETVSDDAKRQFEFSAKQAEKSAAESTDPAEKQSLLDQAQQFRDKAAGINFDSVFDELGQQIDNTFQSKVDAAANKAAAAAKDFEQRTKGGGDRTAVDAAQAELDRLLDAAAAAKANVAADQAKKKQQAADAAEGVADQPKTSDKLFGTFSANAALAAGRAGGAGNPMKAAVAPVVTEMKQWNLEEAKRHQKLLDTIKASAGKIGAG